MGCGFENDKIHSEEIILVKNKKHSPAEAKGETEFYGPTTKRKCRDIFCLTFFFIFVLFLLMLIAYAAIKGDYKKLTHGGYNSNCDICGIQNKHKKGIPGSGEDLRKFPYLIYKPDNGRILETLANLGIEGYYFRKCVSSCPIEYKPILNRCVPLVRNLTGAADFYTKIGLQNFYEEINEDLEKTWKDILWMSLFSLIVAFSITLLLRYLVKAIVWLVIIGVIIASISGTIALWIYYWMQLKIENKSSTDWDTNRTTTLLVFSILASAFTFVIFAIIFWMRRQIGLVIHLFYEAGRAIQCIPFLLFQPFWTFLALGVVSVSWLAVTILIESAGDPEPYNYYAEDRVHNRCRIVKDTVLLIARWSNLFGFIWISQFIISCQHIIIAGSISKWFFTRDKSTLNCPILESFDNLVRFHLGSVALGSIIIAIVKFIRLILNLFHKRLNKQNQICQKFLSIFNCCSFCLEKILIFINRNAYIEIAIYGLGFCESAKKAFDILVTNALKVAAINSIGDFILFLAKAVIVIITLLFGYHLLRNRDEIHYIWIPLTIGGFFSYFIAHCHISVYEMTIDTIFICFCEDCQRNDGVYKSFYMSKGLMEFVQESRRVIQGQSQRERNEDDIDTIVTKY